MASNSVASTLIKMHHRARVKLKQQHHQHQQQQRVAGRINSSGDDNRVDSRDRAASSTIEPVRFEPLSSTILRRRSSESRSLRSTTMTTTTTLPLTRCRVQCSTFWVVNLLLALIFCCFCRVQALSTPADSSAPASGQLTSELTVTSKSTPARLSANIGDTVILKCAFDYALGEQTPYAIHWVKDGQTKPIYLYYNGIPPHIGTGYEGRVSLADSGREASLNLSRIRETDQGWYECKTFYLMKQNEPNPKNGTLVLLEVNSPPHFKEKPPESVFVNEGESLTVHCRAHGTPTPTIIWQKDNNPLVNNNHVRVHGGELHLKDIRSTVTGDYVCVAKNRQGTLHASTKVLISSQAVIVERPRNTTVQEDNPVEMQCGAVGTPSNITTRWFHKGIIVTKLSWLAHRTEIKQDGTLLIRATKADDTGLFTCDVTNGVGGMDTASAYLNVEYAARVTYSPPQQYLPLGMSGIVKCYIQASPPISFVTWTRDREKFEPEADGNVKLLSNGSLWFQKVSHEHQGVYRCKPYNIHGTAQSSDPMDVIVREPPMFRVRPPEYYVASVDDDLTMSCEGLGQPKPTILWRKIGGNGKLPKERSFTRNGNITLTNLRKEDFGSYECVLKNEIATMLASTAIRLNGTTPYPPSNVTINTSASSATVMWRPDFDGGLPQHFIIRFRSADEDESGWKTMRVQPTDSRAFSIYTLLPEVDYEFQVFAANSLGRGQGSEIVRARTKSKNEVEMSMKNIAASTSPPMFDENSLSTLAPPSLSTPNSFNSQQLPPADPMRSNGGHNVNGPAHRAPQNVSISKMAQGWVVSWLPPEAPVAFYRVSHREGDAGDWISSGNIARDTAYLIKELKTSVKYTVIVSAYSIEGDSSASPPYEYRITGNSTSMKGSRAITAGVVGSILFFVAAIILSVCTVKICNKRKQRKMEKAYMMVTCPVMDSVNGTHSHHASPVTIKQIAQSNKKDLHKAEYQV